MLPMMCDQLACINIAVRIVIHWWPEVIWAGIADHVVTNVSPPISSRTKTKQFTRMIRIVTMGMRAGRLDASPNGIMPPTRCSSIRRDKNQLQPWFVLSNVRAALLRSYWPLSSMLLMCIKDASSDERVLETAAFLIMSPLG